MLKNKYINPVRIATFAILAVILSLPLNSHAQSSGNAFIQDSVATVNGELLTEDELLFTLIRLYAGDMIYNLVEDEIIVSQSESVGVALEPGEVDEYLASAYAPDKLAALRSAFGDELLNWTVGNQILALKTVTTKIELIVAEHELVISEEDIRDFYLANLLLLTTPAQVQFSLIETTTLAEAEAAKQRIIAGEDFADVCREVSTHPVTREFGGDIGALVPQGYSTGERAILETTAFELEIGAVSEPLEVDDKYYLVTPTEKIEYYEPTLDEVQDEIHAVLLDEMVQPYLEEWLSGLVDNAEYEISYPVLVNTQLTDFTPGADGSFIAPAVGVVNGRSIPEGALLFHLLREYGSDAIKSVIEEILFVQVGEEMGISMSVDEVRAGLTEAYGGEILQVLDIAFGSDAISTSFLRYLVGLDVLVAKYQEIIEINGIEVTEDEVINFYLENLHSWTTPETVRISMLVSETEANAQGARTRIANGESFDAVCREESIDERSRVRGGDIGVPISRGMFPGESSAIEENAFNMEVGSVSQPFQVGTSWLIIKVTDKVSAYEPTLGEMREMIYAELLEARVEPFLNGWRGSVWNSAEIDIAYPIYQDGLD